MSFTKLNDDLAVIAKLEDEPNDVGGLTAAELKAKFDQAGETIKVYLNETLLPQLEGENGAGRLGALLNGEPTTVQGALDILRAAIQRSGNVPTGGSAGELLVKQSDEVYDAQWQEVFTTVEFTAAQWVQDGGGYTLTLEQSAHKRTGDKVNCLLRHLVDGAYADGTWAVLGTRSTYDAATGRVTLSAGEPYAGSAAFFG